MTIITDENIHIFVKKYMRKYRKDKSDKNKPGLPGDLKNIPIGEWDVSNVTNMSNLFNSDSNHVANFNEPLNWDVSNVTDMSYMFYGCKMFNQDISQWDVSNVTNMSFTFYNCVSFNQPLNWDVSNVTDMRFMFALCRTFNQDISNWNVSNVLSMNSMFYHCYYFNQDLSYWDVSKVDRYNHIQMFRNCRINEDNEPIFNDDPNYSQKKQEKAQQKKQKEQQKQNKLAYEFIPKITTSRNLPEQINTAVGSYLIDDKLDIMNQTMLEATNKNTNTVINEDPDVKMGIGGKKGRKSRKLRKKMKSRRKLRK